MRHAVHLALAEALEDRPRVAAVRPEQFLPYGSAERVHEGIHLHAGLVEQKLPGQGVSVRVQAVRHQPDQRISRMDRGAVHDALAFDDSDDGPRQIVLSLPVELREFGHLAADQRTSRAPASLGHALDHRGHDLRLVVSHPEVVQKEQRLCPVNEDVVHTVCHNIDADRVVFPRSEGHLQLRPHTVRTRHQYGVLVVSPRDSKESTESADVGQHLRAERGSDDGSDPTLRLVRSINIDTSRCVGIGLSGHIHLPFPSELSGEEHPGTCV